MKVPARIAAIRLETPTIKSFRLDVRDPGFSFLPGQWLDCCVEIDGRHEVAGYSMTSSPLNARTISLAVKLVGENPVTHFLHRRAAVGDQVHVDGGQGDFYYQRSMGESLVLVGGGIGLTPLMSIVRYVEEAEPDVNVTLLYSARTPSELLFHDQLNEIAVRNERIRCLFSVTGRSEEAWSGRLGRIAAVMLRDAGIDLGALFYVSGPPAMVDDVVGTLEALGIRASHVKHESW